MNNRRWTGLMLGFNALWFVVFPIGWMALKASDRTENRLVDKVIKDQRQFDTDFAALSAYCESKGMQVGPRNAMSGGCIPKAPQQPSFQGVPRNPPGTN